MTLAPNTHLGPYEILAPIGAGGMGEVYKAKDARLDRFVAVKVLPEHLAKNPEALARFESEAKAVAALNHPSIMGIFDIGHLEDTAYAVMELLEGESLRTRLEQGPIAPRKATELAIQMAQGLSAAHEKGVVHRDLKPENLWITKEGRLKILDFGLAKQLPALVVDSGSLLATEVFSQGPRTEKGMILGTLGYMSPEQVRGEAVDARSDLFSFGIVLFEMLTGRKAFARATPADTLSAILKEDPPELEEQSRPIPPGLRRILDHCLEKAPSRRFHNAEDLAFALENLSTGSTSHAPFTAPFAPKNRRTTWIWAAVAAILLAGSVLLGWYLRGGPARPNLIRFEIANPPEVTKIDAPRISPDGLHLAFSAVDASGKSRIWVRSLNALVAQPLAGTEGASRPFWAPDSRFIGFMAEGKLKKIDVAGGPAQKICDAPGGSDGSWSSEGVILYDGSGSQPINRVSAAGGTPAVAVKIEPSRKETMVGWPEFLPDGRHFLYLATGEKPDDSVYRVGRLDSMETQILAPAQTLVTYAHPGYLLFVRDKTLLAQPFDAKSLRMKGEPIPIAEHIGTDNVGLACFSVSRNGTLIYQTGESGDRFLWVDRSGREGESEGEPGDYHNPAFAPGGDRLAFDLADKHIGKTDIWIRDLKRKVSSRFSFSSGAFCPLWSPDGRTIVFTVGNDLFEKPVEGQGEERLLLKSEEQKFACGWSRDGRYLAYTSMGKETNWDIWVLPLFGDRKPFLFLKTPFAELMPTFSPDGRFLAYQSNESGRMEIYIQSFPGPGGKWQISAAGGTDPQWRADGRELYYRAPDQKVMAIDIQAGNGITAGTPQPLFPGRFDSGLARNRYLPTADGKRFLTVAPLGRESMTPTTVVLNWNAELGH